MISERKEKRLLVYGLVALQALVLVTFGVLEWKSIRSGEPAFHHLLLVLLPIAFFITGMVKLYFLIDLQVKSLFVKSVPFVILIVFAAAFFVESYLDHPTFKRTVLAIEVFSLLLLAFGLRKFKGYMARERNE